MLDVLRYTFGMQSCAGGDALGEEERMQPIGKRSLLRCTDHHFCIQLQLHMAALHLQDALELTTVATSHSINPDFPMNSLELCFILIS